MRPSHDRRMTFKLHLQTLSRFSCSKNGRMTLCDVARHQFMGPFLMQLNCATSHDAMRRRTELCDSLMIFKFRLQTLVQQQIYRISSLRIQRFISVQRGCIAVKLFSYDLYLVFMDYLQVIIFMIRFSH